jgi:hypothetical protein
MLPAPAATDAFGERIGEGFGDGVGVGAGFAEAAAGSAALDAVAVVAAGLPFVSGPSLVPANTGATNTTAKTELPSQLFRFISYVVLRKREPFIGVGKPESLLPRGLWARAWTSHQICVAFSHLWCWKSAGIVHRFRAFATFLKWIFIAVDGTSFRPWML